MKQRKSKPKCQSVTWILFSFGYRWVVWWFSCLAVWATSYKKIGRDYCPWYMSYIYIFSYGASPKWLNRGWIFALKWNVKLYTLHLTGGFHTQCLCGTIILDSQRLFCHKLFFAGIESKWDFWMAVYLFRKFICWERTWTSGNQHIPPKGKRKIIFKSALVGGYASFHEGI